VGQKTKTRRPPLRKGKIKTPFEKGGRRAFSLYGGGIYLYVFPIF